MTKEERIKLWEKRANLLQDLSRLTLSKQQAQDAGDKAFADLKDRDIEQAYEAGDKAGWVECDVISEEITKCQKEADELYKLLEQNPCGLADFESCATVGHTKYKQLEVVFLDGKKAIGYILPWESDYRGPPYYFVDDKESVYLGNGWFILEVKLLEVKEAI